MTTKPKKTPAPKAWRGMIFDTQGQGHVKPKGSLFIRLPKNGSRGNCLVVPSGAPIPLPPAVRRLIKAALGCHFEWDPNNVGTYSQREFVAARDAYRKSIAKGAKK